MFFDEWSVIWLSFKIDEKHWMKFLTIYYIFYIQANVNRNALNVL